MTHSQPKRVLILGGTGHLGQAVLRECAHAGCALQFTYCTNHTRARELASDCGARKHALDLRDAKALPTLFTQLHNEGQLPEVVIHCAGVASPATLSDITLDAWDDMHAIHGRAALQVAQAMQRHQCVGALVLVAALDGILPVPAPAHYAASQAAMWGLTQALAKELAPQGILVNLAVLGVLDGGISTKLDARLAEQYCKHSAQMRLGQCAEVAKGVRWLALENRYINGAQFPMHGGLQ